MASKSAWRFEPSVDDRLQAVRQKFQTLGVVDEGGVFRENGALFGRHDIVFNRNEPTSAGLAEEFVKELEKIGVVRCRNSLIAEGDFDFFDDIFEQRHGAGDDHEADGDTDNDDILGDWKQEAEFTTRHHEAAEC